jgi:hypothetical protein
MVKNEWAEAYLNNQQGISVEQMLGEWIGGIIFDESMNILSATNMAARMLDTGVKDLIGANLVEMLMARPSWPWVPWVHATQQVSLFENILKDAVKNGSTGREVNILTRSQMIYRGNINVLWRSADRTFALWINVVDPLTTSDGSIALTAWIDGDNLRGSLGNHISRAELDLLLDYCKTKTIKELAGKYNTTAKAMEHRLRGIAERYGCASISELAKHQMHRRLVTVAQPHNTLRVDTELNLFDSVRYRIFPSHILPRIAAMGERLRKSKASDMARQVINSVFGD